jgi:hypothetical protein
MNSGDETHEQNLLYVKIYEILLQYSSLAIDDMRTTTLKTIDTKTKLDKVMDKIENKVSNLKSYYLKSVEQELSVFMKKYFSNDKLYPNKVSGVAYVLIALEISLDELKAVYELKSVDKDDHWNILMLVLNKWVEKRDKDLDDEVEGLEKELAEMRRRNILSLEKYKIN